MPEYAHLPGVNPRPGEDFLDHVYEAAAASASPAGSPESVTWRYGLRLLREGYNWECHEVLEGVWMEMPHNSRERFLVQGVIHIANARLKKQMNRGAAADKLFALAREAIGRAFAGTENATLMALDRTALERAALGENVKGLES